MSDRQGCILNSKVVLLVCLALLSSSIRHAIAEKTASDFTLTDIDGVEFSLSKYRGKAVLLDFFATNCGPCVAEFAHLKTVHEEFGEDLIIISISVSPSFDTVQKLQQFRQEHGIDWIIARDTGGVRGNYPIHTIPTLVIIDEGGYIRYIREGLTGASTLSEGIGYVISFFLKGDTNSDGKVNILDVASVARYFGSHPGDEEWNATADLNNDKVINILDVAIPAGEFGKSTSPFNFLLNPSVEIDKNGDSSPECWNKGKYADVDAVHNWLDTGHMDSRSVKVSITHNPSALGWHSAYWYQSFPPFEIGSRYLFRFWYKSSIKCYIYTIFWNGNGQVIEDQKAMCEPATTWTVSQWLESTVPEGAYSMALGISVMNSDAAQETNAYAIGDDFELILG